MRKRGNSENKIELSYFKRNKAVWISSLVGIIFGYYLFGRVKEGVLFDMVMYLVSSGGGIGRTLYLCRGLGCLIYGIIFSLIPFIIIGALIGFLIQKFFIKK